MRGVYKYFALILAVSALFAIAFLIFFHSESPLADALFFTGALISSLGTLALLFLFGEFDTLGYLLSRARSVLLPWRKYKHQTFYDYKTARSKRHGKMPYFTIAIGIFFVVISIFSF